MIQFTNLNPHSIDSNSAALGIVKYTDKEIPYQSFGAIENSGNWYWPDDEVIKPLVPRTIHLLTGIPESSETSNDTITFEYYIGDRIYVFRYR